VLGNAGINFFTPTPAPPLPQTLPTGAARNFAVNPAVAADGLLIAAGQSGEAGDNANALDLAALSDLKILNANTKTFAEGFASLQFKVGTAAQSSKRTLDDDPDKHHRTGPFWGSTSHAGCAGYNEDSDPKQ
jgi:flagellar hook-associated protein FlgK